MVFYTERDIFSQVSTSIIQEKMKSIGKGKISNNFEFGMATRGTPVRVCYNLEPHNEIIFFCRGV